MKNLNNSHVDAPLWDLVFVSTKDRHISIFLDIDNLQKSDFFYNIQNIPAAQTIHRQNVIVKE